LRQHQTWGDVRPNGVLRGYNPVGLDGLNQRRPRGRGRRRAARL